MADVNTAGNLIAALLEHQGYLTQARLLGSLQSFFRDAGALIYLLAGAGGVVSVALYGSFRAARYLLFGPALFWFLVGPTTETEGVLFKLGGGAFRGKLRTEGEGAASQTRQEVLEKLNQAGAGPDQNINVAIGFWLFARPINEFVNEFVDRMLHDEDRSDLMVSSKVQALELLAGSLPTRTETISRLEGLYQKCMPMMTAAMAAGLLQRKQQDVPNSQAQRDLLESKRQAQLAKVREEATRPFPVGDLTHFRSHIQAHINRPGHSEVIDDSFAKSVPTSEDNPRGLAPKDFITCGDGWRIVAEEIWHHAGEKVPRLLRTVTSIASYDQAAEYGCQELTMKAVGGDGECNLRPAIALALFNQHITRLDTFGRMIDRHMNEGILKNPTQHTRLTSGISGGGPVGQILVGGLNVLRGFADAMGSNVGGVLTEAARLMENPKKVEVRAETRPFSSLTMITSPSEAMWISRRQLETAELRAHLYTYVLQLPYYQGVLLYLLSISYPFLALLVILPGKGFQFLNLPLAWLWVKSWDIGFAAIIILDKVLYNLLPSTQVSETLRTGPWIGAEVDKTLPQVFAEAINYDPLGSVHVYYATLSMAWLSMPVLLGTITLGVRRNILSAFTDAPQSQAKDAGDRIASAFMIAEQDRRTIEMQSMNAFARELPTMGAGGIGGGPGGAAVRELARQAALASSFRATVAAGRDHNINEPKGQALVAGVDEYNRTYFRQVEALTGQMVALDGAMLASRDPILGFRGSAGMRLNAAMAALSDGYEINDDHSNLASALLEMEEARLRLGLEAIRNVAEAETIIAAAAGRNFFTRARHLWDPARFRPGGGFTEAEAAAVLLMNDPSVGAAIFGNPANPESAQMSRDEYYARLYGAHQQTIDWQMRGNNDEVPPPLHLGNDTYTGIMRDFFSLFTPNIDDFPGSARSPIGGPSESGYFEALLSSASGDRRIEIMEFATEEQARDFVERLRSRAGGLGNGPGASFAPSPELLSPENIQRAYEELLHTRPFFYQDDLEGAQRFISTVLPQQADLAAFLTSKGIGQEEIDQLSLGDWVRNLSEFTAGDDLKVNPELQALADSNPLFVASRLEQWIASRYNVGRQNRLILGAPQGTIVTSPLDLYEE